jgi:hypothetical protein
VLRTVGDQPSLWESMLPAEVLALPAELARVDTLLDDPRFLAPFAAFFDARVGRPSTAMETYLRLMFLKFRYRLGYERLCREVNDSITWRRFARIGLAGTVPDPTTLMKLTKRFGPSVVEALNEALLPGRARRRCCARLGCARTPRWCPRTWPTRPTRACWPRRCAGSVPRCAGSGRPVAPPAPGCGTGDAPRAPRHTRSAPSCAPGRRPDGTRRRPASNGSPPSWPTWLPAPPGTPRRCWAMPAGRSAGPRPKPRPGSAGDQRSGDGPASGRVTARH